MSFFKNILNRSNPFSKNFWLWDAGRNWLDVFKGDESLTDAFMGDGSATDSVLNSVGSLWNRMSGQYASAEHADHIADENADVQFDREVELMKMEHEMNSVGTKAKQLASAGLNPVLASGVGNSVGGHSASMSTPNSGQGDMSNVVGTLLNVFKSGAEIDELKASADEHKANAQAALASADERRANTDLINKEVARFDEKFDLDKAEKEARTAQLKQAVKNMKHSIVQGYIDNLSRLGMAFGVVVGAFRGLRNSSPIEVLEPDVLDNPNGPIRTPDFDGLPKMLGSGNVNGTRDYKYDSSKNIGSYTMDDGSVFEYGLNEDGLPWSRAFDNQAGENSMARSLMDRWNDYIRKVFD